MQPEIDDSGNSNSAAADLERLKVSCSRRFSDFLEAHLDYAPDDDGMLPDEGLVGAMGAAEAIVWSAVEDLASDSLRGLSALDEVWSVRMPEGFVLSATEPLTLEECASLAVRRIVVAHCFREATNPFAGLLREVQSL